MADRKEVKSALVDVANKIISNDIDMLYGIREICDISIGMEEWCEYPIVLFHAINSETDAFAHVTEKNKHLYSSDFLQRQNDALNDYFESCRKEIIEGAQSIIQKFSQPDSDNGD